MNVIASTGLKVPLENKPNTYIDDTASVQVDESAYYLRRISDGDLVQVADTKETTKVLNDKGAK